MDSEGFEPPASALQRRHSAAELRARSGGLVYVVQLTRFT